MRILLLAFTLLVVGCATQAPSRQGSATPPPTEIDAHLEKGLGLLSRNATKAIAEFDKAIALCDQQLAEENRRIYASRSSEEALFYLVSAAARAEDAIAIEPACAEALYLKGYASLEIGAVEAAEAFIKSAVDMAPLNSMFLSELGHINHVKKDWESALAIFIEAEQAARDYSPPEVRQRELSRAMRGVGFSLIELGRLQEAELKFRECLEFDKNDEGARSELQYIEQLQRGS